MFRPYFRIALVLLAVILAGCSALSTPRLIASYPGSPAGSSSVPQNQIVYSGSMELSVSDVSWAAQQAEDLTYRYGGYVSSSSTWQRDGAEAVTLVLAVSASNFNPLHDALLGLGDLKNEDFTGDLWNAAPGGWIPYSQIALTLLPRSFPKITIPSPGWHPLSTLAQAFNVFLSIFGFLVDILIWIVVVLGPFILIGWVALFMIRRLRAKT